MVMITMAVSRAVGKKSLVRPRTPRRRRRMVPAAKGRWERVNALVIGEEASALEESPSLGIAARARGAGPALCQLEQDAKAHECRR
jgi:hypothetical protein